jgi:hypothetical protein
MLILGLSFSTYVFAYNTWNLNLYNFTSNVVTVQVSSSICLDTTKIRGLPIGVHEYGNIDINDDKNNAHPCWFQDTRQLTFEVNNHSVRLNVDFVNKVQTITVDNKEIARKDISKSINPNIGNSYFELIYDGETIKEW